MIALINYGSGNIRSVFNALQHEGADVRLVSTPGAGTEWELSVPR